MLGFGFVFHKDPTAIQGGGIAGNPAEVIRYPKAEVPVVGQPLFGLKVLWAHYGGYGIYSQCIAAQAAASGSEGVPASIGFLKLRDGHFRSDGR